MGYMGISMYIPSYYPSSDTLKERVWAVQYVHSDIMDDMGLLMPPLDNHDIFTSL